MLNVWMWNKEVLIQRVRAQQNSSLGKERGIIIPFIYSMPNKIFSWEKVSRKYHIICPNVKFIQSCCQTSISAAKKHYKSKTVSITCFTVFFPEHDGFGSWWLFPEAAPDTIKAHCWQCAGGKPGLKGNCWEPQQHPSASDSLAIVLPRLSWTWKRWQKLHLTHSV